jgi:hypothetical protein
MATASAIVASGPDADFAVAAIVELIEGGMGESAALPPTAGPAAVVEAVRAAPPPSRACCAA